ncbi:M23 family metallopeptidase [Enterovirga aerilata]|uniref:M23 family metallopeptidase n=1 Tax=Enterovirga aerilata TaxID=2730920 RepID=UPI003211D14E
MSELARTVSRFAMIGAVGSLAAACSSDAMRLSSTPFANPFASEQSEEPSLTGSVDAPSTAAPMPRSSVRSVPLAPPAQKVASAPAYNRPAPVEGANASRPAVAGLNPAVSAPAPRAAAPARVAQSVPAPATRPEQGRLVSRSQMAEVRPAPAPAAEKARIRPGQLTWQKGPEPAKAAAVPEPKAQPRSAQKMAAVPEKPVAVKEAPRLAKVEPAKPAQMAAAQPKSVEPVKAAAKPEPQKVAAVAAPKPEPAKPAREPESTASLPVQPATPSAEFRWPARGRVISGFGGAGGNEGINIAVPDGTPVKAAEAGTVAYAGNEVKGYGNLVLIRHDNGYVSAYAHNGEIEVKRGQRVSRGQVIAKSGQSGNVTSPQLHFEIRKGSTPVDPMQYLASN